MAIEQSLEYEIGRALEIVGQALARSKDRNEADRKTVFTDAILSTLSWDLPESLRLARGWRRTHPKDYLRFCGFNLTLSSSQGRKGAPSATGMRSAPPASAVA